MLLIILMQVSLEIFYLFIVQNNNNPLIITYLLYNLALAFQFLYSLERRLDSIEQRLGSIEQRLNRFDERLLVVEQKLGIQEKK